ncbi:MAG: hypothetical protein R3F62_23810 [Planctomycetota bacterium]
MRKQRGPLLAVEETPGGLRFTALHGDEVRGQVEAPSTGNLANDLRAGLSQAQAQRLKLPKRALFLSERVSALCLELPPLAEASADEVEQLVRFELEPLIPDAGPGGVSCGWASPAGGAPGPLLTCGLPQLERQRLAAQFKSAGLLLVGLYPRLGCAQALLPLDVDQATLVEGQGAQLAVTLVVGGRVERVRVISRESQRGALEGARSLISGPVFASGELEPAVLDALETRSPSVTPVGLGLPASALGAARHAWRWPGGERVAGLGTVTKGPPVWRQGPALAAGLLLALGLAVFAADLSLAAWRDGAEARLRELERTREQGADAERARKGLLAERDALRHDLEPLREDARRQQAAGDRAQALSALLETLAAAPAGIALDRFSDGSEQAEVEGLASDGATAEAFLQSLERALALRPLVPTQREVQRTPEGFRFSASFAAPPRPPEVK